MTITNNTKSPVDLRIYGTMRDDINRTLSIVSNCHFLFLQ